MRKNIFIIFLLLIFLLIFNCPISDSGSSSSGGDNDGVGSDKVVAKLQVFRSVTKADGIPIVTQDTFSANFGEDIDICGNISSPLKAGGVTCNGDTLFWLDSFEGYMYTSIVPFLQYSTNYTFDVTASSSVPALTKSIIFPSFNPDITSPEPGEIIDKSNDLTIEWDKGDGTGSVLIILSVDSEISGFSLETTNDGNQVISSDQLIILPDGECAILVESRNYDTINASGYDNRSFILARSICTTLVNLE